MLSVLGGSLLVFAGETIDAQDATRSLAIRRAAATSARIAASRRSAGVKATVAQTKAVELASADPEPSAKDDAVDAWSLDEVPLDPSIWRSMELPADLPRSSGDAVQEFDRELAAAGFEPRWYIADDFFATARFRELGTNDDDDFHGADGDLLDERGEAFGFDTQRFQRISAGLGWIPRPGTVLKLEGGRDRFGSSDAHRDERVYLGLELVLRF